MGQQWLTWSNLEQNGQASYLYSWQASLKYHAHQFHVTTWEDWLLLHAADAVQCGFTKILLRTVDTDVLILAVAFVEKLKELQGDQTIELWVGFGTGAHLRYIATHDISSKLKPQVPKALPFFHAFTGCDTVSYFYGKGKKDSNGHVELFS